MEKGIERILAKTIQLEEKVGALYRLFAGLFPEDRGFWNSLADEEARHASIITRAGESLIEEGNFPLAALDPNLENIKSKIAEVTDTIAQFKRAPPTRVDALIRALEIEVGSSEFFFQFALDLPFKSPAHEMLRTMTSENKNHITKILHRVKSFRLYVFEPRTDYP